MTESGPKPEITTEYLFGYLVGNVDAILKDQILSNSEKIKEISKLVEEAKSAMKIDKE